jgi:hypothetical protein
MAMEMRNKTKGEVKKYESKEQIDLWENCGTFFLWLW